MLYDVFFEFYISFIDSYGDYADEFAMISCYLIMFAFILGFTRFIFNCFIK